ncbi:potassium transporter Kup [Aliihoeflea aestuarii]|jgi:KUP system potassium uptake protein|uniref:potassium transporter Kup n=1 Tax=Aliihoeflea aestuarii TaxID=453840 RepID=UPI002094FE83|nr:potassium transporter Kup [Aliihoeflea aestuarii]MCO6392296.1 potassium transporter Kup [Aliihoeflea aestuarii]
MQASVETSPQTSPLRKRQGTGALALAAIGVVYGDIGTSPIYALREAMRATASPERSTDVEVMGVLSIIVWSLTLIVTIKYVLIVLRADNNGEGGTLSLMALARQNAGRFSPGVMLLGMIGAGLFLGDALITPAISVLSAVEGLEVATPTFAPYVIPITVVILVALFIVQKRGTASVASVFGPITACWFLVLGGLGLWHIIAAPQVLAALNPSYAVGFLFSHSAVAFAVIGAAFLAVTGAEAIYADLGHFGRKPIVLAWFGLVFPALLLNYFGQGAFILTHDEVAEQPLFQMVPEWGVLPLVVLATVATIIASQAVITGTFSLASQAIQLGILPRFAIFHTSDTQSGQIFMPQINGLLLIGVVILVLEFGSSSALAGAYGISVTGEMVVTALLLMVVLRKSWKWPLVAVVALVVPFLLLDLVFLAANSLKFLEGGWVSVGVALAAMVVMMTWRRGSALLFRKTRKSEVPLDVLTNNLAKNRPTIVSGTAVFLTSDPESAPTALMHSLKHYKVLHERNIILTVATVETPRVSREERIKVESINDLFVRVVLYFGYAERPNVPKGLARCQIPGWQFDIMTTSFFLSRRTLKASSQSAMPKWQDRLYIALARNASDATAYFQIPSGRVVEIGTQLVI